MNKTKLLQLWDYFVAQLDFLAKAWPSGLSFQLIFHQYLTCSIRPFNSFPISTPKPTPCYSPFTPSSRKDRLRSEILSPPPYTSNYLYIPFKKEFHRWNTVYCLHVLTIKFFFLFVHVIPIFIFAISYTNFVCNLFRNFWHLHQFFVYLFIIL